MILFSHPIGNANAREAALALAEAGLLGELWTAFAWDSDSALSRFLPGAWRRQLERRTWPSSVRGCLHTTPLREVGRLLAGRLGARWLGARESDPLSIDSVFRAQDRRVARRIRRGEKLAAIYAYEDAAAASFRAAQARGVRRIYDLPIGFWRAGQAIFREEAARQPEWAATLTGNLDSAAKLEGKDEELALAETVLVASSFTRATLADAPSFSARVHVIPYGAPAVRGESRPATDAQKLRVLFAGSLTQRKGLSYLLEAVSRLGARVELTLLGSTTRAACPAAETAVRRHRWLPSRPHGEVLREMARHDVLVLPSLFEGFGLVILEALAQGTPVITTPHTAGPDVLEDGVDGFLVPIRDAGAIAEKLELLLREPERRRAMSAAAQARARQLTWSTYRSRLASVVAEAAQETSRP